MSRTVFFCMGGSGAFLLVDVLSGSDALFINLSGDAVVASAFCLLSVLPSRYRVVQLGLMALAFSAKLAVPFAGLPVFLPVGVLALAIPLCSVCLVRSINLISTGTATKVAATVNVLCQALIFESSASLFLISLTLSGISSLIMAFMAVIMAIYLVIGIPYCRKKGLTVVGTIEHIRNFKVVSVSDFAFQKANGDSGVDSSMQRLYRKLEEGMKSQRYYLDEDLTLDSLAALLATNKSYLSKTINTCSQYNMRQYVNNYRVKYAMELMTDGTRRKMDEVASMSGFHNTVSFNMAFKLHIGETPSEWLEAYRIMNL